MKVYVDDKRPAPEGWVLCENIRSAREFICDNAEKITHISFDGYLSEKMPSHTGLLLIQYLATEEHVFHQPRENYTTHSADSYMNEQMDDVLDDIFGIKKEQTQKVSVPFSEKRKRSKRLFRV